ncbi:DUF3617 domain-containing protein [Sphingomonas sp. RS6]
MRVVGAMRVAAGAALLVMAGNAVAQKRGPALPLLASVEKGKWQFRDAEGNTREMCISDPQLLVQIYHGPDQCQQFLVDSTERGATVRYVCPGHGHGRTTISLETPRLVSLDTQGVADGAPFSEQLEGRRIGNCP